MQKAGHRHWKTLLLMGCALLLGAGLFIQGMSLLWSWLNPGIQPVGRGDRSVTDECISTQRTPVFGRPLIVGEHEVVCGDLTLLGSTLDVTGQVRGNILAFGSNINIAGIISGDVDLYGGYVTLQNGSHVHGNINLYGGRARTEPGAGLEGGVNNRSQHISLWLPGLSDGFAFPFWPVLIWVALGLVLVSLLPEHVMFVRATVASKARRSLLLGLLSLLLAPAVLIVLIALIIPIPLAIIIVGGLIAAWALGTIAIGWLMGEYVMQAIAPRHNTRLAQVAVGLTVLILAESLPYIGWLVSIGAGLVGLGAVFLSRFGTRLYGQPRHPLKL
jgi:hypothetical protein